MTHNFNCGGALWGVSCDSGKVVRSDCEQKRCLMLFISTVYILMLLLITQAAAGSSVEFFIILTPLPSDNFYQTPCVLIAPPAQPLLYQPPHVYMMPQEGHVVFLKKIT